MSIAATKVAVLGNPDTTERQVLILFSLALTSPYSPANNNGDIVPFGSASGAVEIASDQVPVWVDVFEAPAAGIAPSFYQGVYCPGPTRDTGQISFALAGVQANQNANYPAALLAAAFFALAAFPAFV